MKLLRDFTLLLFVGGCIHFVTGSEQVVERSKGERPGWTELDEGELVENEKFLQLIGFSDQIASLPLGIKKLQLRTLEQGEHQFVQFLLKSVQKTAATRELELNDQESQQIRSKVEKTVAKNHGKHANIQDIYFEKIQRTDEEIAEFFRIYVLLTYQKETFPKLYLNIATDLNRSPNSKIKRLSKVLTETYKASLSH